MNSKLIKFALTAALVLAITLTLAACEEKEKKQTASENQPSAEEGCPKKEGPPKTVEAIFLENDDSDPEGFAWSIFTLPSGEKLSLSGTAPDDIKKGDKVSVTHKYMEEPFPFNEDKCQRFNLLVSVKKIGGPAYKTAKIGNQTWMAENLNADESGSLCYDNDPANCQKYGRLYNWEAAKKACPSGWKLPSKAELEVLIKTLGGKETAGKKLKSKSGWNDNGTDDFGFSALPSGQLAMGGDEGGFEDIGSFAGWWSATKQEPGANAFKEAYSLVIDNNNLFIGFYHEESMFSVRCIQN